MYKLLYIFFGKWFDAIIRFLQVSGGAIAYLLSSGFGIVLAILMWATSVLNWVSRLIYYLAVYLDRMKLASDITTELSDTSTILSMLETINTFYPLVETFAICIALASLAAICGMYGLIKSWIPTVSG